MDAARVVIEPATADDLHAIDEIYTHYVVHSAISFDLEPWSRERRRRWFSTFGERGRHRLVVARGADGLVGYAASGPHRSKAGYDASVETSVYVAADHIGRGIGAAMYGALLEHLEREDVHRAYAGIAMPNPPSVKFHLRFGFRRAGYYSEQGRKFGRYWDVAWYERAFDRRID